jgi:hypothetical protein
MVICGQTVMVSSVLASTLVVGAGSIITAACIAVALKMLIRPGEEAADHPKRRVLSPDR